MNHAEEEYQNIPLEEYIKYLHIAISHIEDRAYRSEMVEHLCQIKDQHQYLEDCYSLPSYEPRRSV